jgi:hypothetical protein
MSYHGYIPLLKEFLSTRKFPRILEIGIDRGATLVPLVDHVSRTHDSFVYMGVDVLVQESLKLTVANMSQPIPSMTYLCELSSLKFLKQAQTAGLKFDLLLLDGDHNYYTVSQEMQYVDDLIDQGGLLVIDDYHGKWSTRDLWYAERSEYKDVVGATAPVATEKHGVKPAVDEWMEKHPEWKAHRLFTGEPIVLRRE